MFLTLDYISSLVVRLISPMGKGGRFYIKPQKKALMSRAFFIDVFYCLFHHFINAAIVVEVK